MISLATRRSLRQPYSGVMVTKPQLYREECTSDGDVYITPVLKVLLDSGHKLAAVRFTGHSVISKHLLCCFPVRNSNTRGPSVTTLGGVACVEFSNYMNGCQIAAVPLEKSV